MTQTNQLLKGVKGEFSALGNKHTCRQRSLSADMHVRASAVIFSLQGFPHVVLCLLGLALAGLSSPWTANCKHNILQSVRLIVMHTRGSPTNTVLLFN